MSRSTRWAAALLAIICSSALLASTGTAGAESETVAPSDGASAAAPPSNDDFADAQVLSVATGEVPGTNVGSTLEPDEPTFADLGDPTTIWYEWTATADGTVTFNTQGSFVDTTMVAYSGTGLEDLVELDESDDKLARESEVVFDAAAGTSYFVQVGGFGGATGLVRLMWWQDGTAPFYDDASDALAFGTVDGRISLTTVDGTIEPGEPDHGGIGAQASSWYAWTPPLSGDVDITLTSGSAAIAMFAPQWNGVDLAYEEGTNTITAAVNAGSTYLIAIAGDEQDYEISWSMDLPAPPNDDFADSFELPGASGAVRGSTFEATTETGEPPHSSSSAAQSVWYRWTPEASGTVQLAVATDPSNTTYPYADADLAVYTGSAVAQLVPVAAAEPVAFNRTVLRFSATAGTTYAIAIDANSSLHELTYGPATATFTDVSPGHPFFIDIEWLADVGLSSGYEDGTFRPSATLTRQALAAFFFRFDGPGGFTPPSTPTFSDVPASHPFFREIEWLADDGLSAGYGDGTFRPGAPLTRQAMATFFFRYVEPEDHEPPTTPTFSDVPAGHPFFTEIEWMEDEGLSSGYGDGTFRPGAPLTRQAMAAFFHRYATSDTIL